MSDGILHRIERVDPKTGYKLLVTWSTGEQTIIDFSEEVKGGGIWTDLRDPQKFARARTVRGGTILEWPEPAGRDGSPRVDVDADGLYTKGLQQRAVPWIENFFQSLFGRRAAHS